MNETLPRIEAVEVVGPMMLRIRWRGDAPPSTIDLSGWIYSGGALLSPLRDPVVFRQARASDYGTTIAWGDEDDGLSIDAFHLKRLAAVE